MRVSKGSTGGLASEKRSDTFTGEVWGDSVLSALDGVMTGSVFFAPGARTYWHSHEKGQLLFIARGRGYVVTRGGEKVEVTAGDMIHAPSGEEHWHGGTSDSFMIHTAVSLGKTNWLDEVSEDEYRKSTRT